MLNMTTPPTSAPHASRPRPRDWQMIQLRFAIRDYKLRIKELEEEERALEAALFSFRQAVSAAKRAENAARTDIEVSRAKHAVKDAVERLQAHEAKISDIGKTLARVRRYLADDERWYAQGQEV